jgi:Nuclease-related domain
VAAQASAGSADGPAPWPGGGIPPQRPESGQRDEGHDRDVAFWDWAPAGESEDARFSLDDDPGAEGPGQEGLAAAAPAAAPPPEAEPVVRPVEVTEVPSRREGIGRRFGKLDHVFGNSRMGAWRRRAVLAIVVGVAVTILVDWRLGLTCAVLVAIADAIFRSRAVAPSHRGVRMSKAQKQTQRQLVKLERSGYRALHSRLIPQSEDHIDHLVIGPAGVFAIDSEAWDKQLPVRTKNARQLWHGPFSMKERLEHARWEADQAADYLSRHAGPGLLASLPGGTVSVRPAMAVYGPKIPWDIATIRDVDVFSGGRLRYYLRRYAKQNHARPLSATQVEQILQAAHSAFPDHDPGVPAASPFASS